MKKTELINWCIEHPSATLILFAVFVYFILLILSILWIYIINRHE